MFSLALALLLVLTVAGGAGAVQVETPVASPRLARSRPLRPQRSPT